MPGAKGDPGKKNESFRNGWLFVWDLNKWVWRKQQNAAAFAVERRRGELLDLAGDGASWEGGKIPVGSADSSYLFPNC